LNTVTAFVLVSELTHLD